LPWAKWFPHAEPQLTERTLIFALFFAILAPHLDMIQSLWVPFEPLGTSTMFQRLGWTQEQVYSIHALGGMFIMVPVVLASWHYGRMGMLLTLGWSGLAYLLTPLFLPPDSFPWLIYAVRGFVVLGMTLILAFTTYTLALAQRQKQAALAKSNTQLAAANQKLTEQAFIMEQLATSRERNRLARELHDTLAHSLSGTAVQLQAIGTLLKVDPQAAGTELKVAQAQIKTGLNEARRAIAALRASTLEELGLAEALCHRAQKLAERSGLAVECDTAVLPTLPPHIEQALYRIADEALINIEKHAQATKIWVLAQTNGRELTLTIRDNGIGFDVDAQKEAHKQSHFGLLGMQERAEMIGAALHIRPSRP
ncbi:MAG: hypothetical protein KDE51_24215, partial [Anaerolineales bacterium]|nr:hypothetical protein [Anaerolineales bacterium]